MLQRLLFALIVILADNGFARAADREFANVHTIAIISNLGNQARVQRIPFTRFGNFEDFKIDLNLNPDTQLVEQIKSVLSKHFTVKDATVNSNAFANIKYGVKDTSEIRDRILALPKSDGIDAYVMIFPEDAIGTELRGINIIHYPGFGDGQTMLGTFYAIGVFDAVTGKRIDYGAARDPLSHAIWGNGPPEEYCANELLPEAADRVSPEQKSRHAKEFQALISRSIASTLASAGLIDKAEIVGATAQFDTQGDATCKPPA